MGTGIMIDWLDGIFQKIHEERGCQESGHIEVVGEGGGDIYNK